MAQRKVRKTLDYYTRLRPDEFHVEIEDEAPYKKFDPDAMRKLNYGMILHVINCLGWHTQRKAFVTGFV